MDGMDRVFDFVRGNLRAGVDRLVIVYPNKILTRLEVRCVPTSDVVSGLPPYALQSGRRLTKQERMRKNTLLIKNIDPYWVGLPPQQAKVVRVRKARICARVERGE